MAVQIELIRLFSKDIAILTNREDLCNYYRSNSENVQGRSACTFDNKRDLIAANDLGVILPITKEACDVSLL